MGLNKTLINISIVLYNTKEYEVVNIYNILINSSSKISIFFIDNSPIPCIDPADYPKAFYINNGKNIGYGSAHNIAIRKSIEENIPYHLVLNPDVYFDPNVLEILYNYMEQHPDVGNIMPKVLYPNGEIQYLCKLLPTPIDLIIRRFIPFNIIKKKMNEKYELHWTGYNKEMNIPNMSGCFMFLRTEALKETGLFDENFFMYMEDVDLNRRIHTKYKTMFYPATNIYHEYGKESYKKFKLLKYHIKSSIYYFNKWGWFFDKERNKINKETINGLKNKESNT